MSLIRNSALRLLVGATLFTLSADVVSAQDPQQLLNQGMSAYRQGNYETARENFREIVALSPDNAAALQMLHTSEDALLELLIAGGEFEAFAREILAAAREGGREMIRDEAAIAAAAEGCFSDDYAKRAEAIFALSQNHGPFGAIPLVVALGDANESTRLAAVYALSRMGSNAMLPVLAASHSTNTEVRLGALHVMHALGDDRCNARLMDMAENDGNGSVQALASSILGDTAGDAAGLNYLQGTYYYQHLLGSGLSTTENYGVLWTIDGRNLEAYDVPQELVELELARHHVLRAVELGSVGDSSLLASIYASEVAVLKGLNAGGAGLESQEAAMNNALLTISQDYIGKALYTEIGTGNVGAAEVLIEALSGPGGQERDGLIQALHAKVPSLRYAAAIALAMQGEYEEPIISELCAAVSLDAYRIVHIIDADDLRASRLADDLASIGIDSFRAADGAAGLVNMHQSLNVDAFVIADPLPDLFASRVLTSLRNDPRFAETPVFVYANGSNDDLEANVVEAVDSSMLVGSFLELDAERARYGAMAARAAKALAHAAHAGHGAGALDALRGALGRGDDIAVPAAYGLGFLGDSAAAPALVGVVGDTNRSSKVRATAANALSTLYSRCGVTVDAGVFQSAMMEGDAALSEACARAIGVMSAGHLSAGVAVQ